MLFYFYHLNIKGDGDFFIFPYTDQELFNFILGNHLRWVEAVCLPLRAGLSSNSRATKNTSALIHCLTAAVSFVRGNNLYSPLSICETNCLLYCGLYTEVLAPYGITSCFMFQDLFIDLVNRGNHYNSSTYPTVF